MDILEEYIFNNSLSGDRVLLEVDEFTLYCFYLGYTPELRRCYSSPLDVDASPSFSIFESNNKYFEYLWKDSGKRMVSGGIFKLIKLMFNYESYDEVYNRIAVDFEIDISKVVDLKDKVVDKTRPISKPPTRIRIKSKPFSKEGLEFWRSFGVDEELLAWKDVKEVDLVWFNEAQQVPIKTRSLCFAYPEYDRVSKEVYYQLYSPFDKEFKFRNDLKSRQVYGFNLLEFKSDIVIITKSNKDILCLKMLGYEAISPRSETTMIKQKVLDWLSTKYTRVLIMYDNDEAGLHAASKYNLPSIIVPIESGCKDLSDYIKMYSVDKAKELMLKLLSV